MEWRCARMEWTCACMEYEKKWNVTRLGQNNGMEVYTHVIKKDKSKKWRAWMEICTQIIVMVCFHP